MLLSQPGEWQLHFRAMLHEAGERDIFTGMMVAIRVLAQVIDNVAHDLVVRVVPSMKFVDLTLQQLKNARKVPVFSVPSRDCSIGVHECTLQPVLSRQLTQIKLICLCCWPAWYPTLRFSWRALPNSS
jgi:hypothetical protein